jgi:hypothetical protein
MTDPAGYEGLQLNLVRLERLKEMQILLKKTNVLVLILDKI